MPYSSISRSDVPVPGADAGRADHQVEAFLGLGEGADGPQLLGDVAQHALHAEHAAFRIPIEVPVGRELQPGAVASPQRQVMVADGAGRVDRLQERLHVTGIDAQVAHRVQPVHLLGGLEAEEPGERGARQHQVADVVGSEEGVFHVFEHGQVPRLALAVAGGLASQASAHGQQAPGGECRHKSSQQEDDPGSDLGHVDHSGPSRRRWNARSSR
jgi:hypothetical protein